MQSRFANDRLLDELVPPLAAPMLLHGDGSFTEGPVWFADLQCLIWSDIPANRMLRLDAGRHVSCFSRRSNYANGNTRDRQGRLVTCEHADAACHADRTRRHDHRSGRRFEGKPLNSPNDVVVKSDGTIWFTDPDYGLRSTSPGEQRYQAHDNVFRVRSRQRTD